MTIPPAAIETTGTSPAASPNTQATQYICLNEYNVEWDRVPSGSLDFSAVEGRVNSDGFLSQPVGTLLCEGVQQDPSFLIIASPHAWKCVVTIKQRKIVIAAGPNAGTYGWNDRYNEKTMKWEPVTLTNGQPPYAKAAFSGMFA